MPRLVSRAELARIAKISAMAITKACRTKLADACTGQRVDLDHPSVLAYLASKGIAPPAPLDPPAEAASEPTAPRPRQSSTPAEASPPRPCLPYPRPTSASISTSTPI